VPDCNVIAHAWKVSFDALASAGPTSAFLVDDPRAGLAAAQAQRYGSLLMMRATISPGTYSTVG
jgi:hypothetical protein